jgi:hypothetical protein
MGTFLANRRDPFELIYWLVTIETVLPQLKIELDRSFLQNIDVPSEDITYLYKGPLDLDLHDQPPI